MLNIEDIRGAERAVTSIEVFGAEREMRLLTAAEEMALDRAWPCPSDAPDKTSDTEKAMRKAAQTDWRTDRHVLRLMVSLGYQTSENVGFTAANYRAPDPGGAMSPPEHAQRRAFCADVVERVLPSLPDSEIVRLTSAYNDLADRVGRGAGEGKSGSETIETAAEDTAPAEHESGPASQKTPV